METFDILFLEADSFDCLLPQKHCMMISEGDTTTIAAVGDILPGDHYFSLGHGIMTRFARGSAAEMFSEPSETLRIADLALCNLEGPLSRATEQRSRVEAAAFRGVPEFCALLRHAGFTHVNVANNHILQHGLVAFEETVHALRSHGLQVVGLAGTHGGQICRPVISRVRGRTLCVVGYSAVPEVHAPGSLPYAHVNDLGRVRNEIAALAREFDAVIVSCHAGDEGLRDPSPALVLAYRGFIEAGARCVLGHHSHVFQPVESHRGGLIAYSLGNFAFDVFWDRNATTSAILLLRLACGEPDWQLIPTEFTRHFRVSAASPSAAADFRQSLERAKDRLTSLDVREYAAAVRAYERRDRKLRIMYFTKSLARGKVLTKLQFLVSKMLH